MRKNARNDDIFLFYHNSENVIDFICNKQTNKKKKGDEKTEKQNIGKNDFFAIDSNESSI